MAHDMRHYQLLKCCAIYYMHFFMQNEFSFSKQVFFFSSTSKRNYHVGKHLNIYTYGT